MKHDEVYLSQIIDAVLKVERFVDGMSKEEFLVDEKTQSAVIMQLALIGELAKKISDDTRQSINLPWREIAGFRDNAIHDYFNIDLHIVWQTILTDIPLLKEELGKH